MLYGQIMHIAELLYQDSKVLLDNLRYSLIAALELNTTFL